MNPLTNIKNLNKLNENEIKQGHVGTKTSWHNQYRDSAWVFVGGLPFELTEGDIICIFEQYGAVVNINLIRDKKTGKSKGFGFICYENQLSTDLAVDNFNGTQILGRTIKVDHAGNYKPPKDHDDADEVTKFLREEGCSAKIINEKKEVIASAFIKQTVKQENRLDDFKDEQMSKEQKKDDLRIYKSENKRPEKDDDRNRRTRRRSRSRSSSSSRSRSVGRKKEEKSYHRHHHDRDQERDRDRYRGSGKDRDREQERDKDRDYYRNRR